MTEKLWEMWKTATGIACIVIPLLVIIFGGEITVHITWSTAIELYNTIRGKGK